MRRRNHAQPLPSAGGPVTRRRRKLAELETPPVSDPVTKRRLAEPEQGLVDRISALSDDLLGEIILLLPIKDAARTQALTSRWRQLWFSVPFSLDCCDLVAKEGTVMHHRSLVSDVLSAHPGPGRRFCIRSQCSADNVAALLRSTALDNLEELDIGCVAFHQPLPTSIFRFSATLRVANIRYCSIPDAAVQAGLRLPHLKQLGLDHVDVSERSLHGLIAGCPVLKSLLVLNCSGFRCLRINSRTLACLCVCMRIAETSVSLPAKSYFGEIVIENAPCLERFIHSYRVWCRDVWVHSAPKVESLEFLTDWQNFATKLMSAARPIPGLPVDSPTAAVHTVKNLSFNLYYLSLDRVVDLMRLFPCLEKLHLKAKLSGVKNCWRRKHQKFIRCHDIRLKTIVLETFLGTLSHINFATFFILNARFLESMEFQTEGKLHNDELLAKHHKKLQLENKVSRGARFYFTTTSSEHSVWRTKHPRDFDFSDPFLHGF